MVNVQTCKRWLATCLTGFVAFLGTGCCCTNCFHKPCNKMSVCAVDSLPRELDKASLPEYVVEPPDILFIEGLGTLPNQPLIGEKLVRPDGTINLGYYGDLHVAGLTLAEIEAKVEERLKHFVKNPRVHVDMAAFNSKVFYVMGQVVNPGRLPVTGNETVLDAIMLSGGLTNYANKCDIRLIRPTPTCSCDLVLPVKWQDIVQCGDTTTNYQLMPGDRVYIPETPGFAAAVKLDNILTPIERILGVINLGRLALGPNDNINN